MQTYVCYFTVDLKAVLCNIMSVSLVLMSFLTSASFYCTCIRFLNFTLPKAEEYTGTCS